MTMTVEVESMAIELPEVEGHPNRVDFRGVLTVVDVISDRVPSGARGHRVVLTRAAAEEALPSLLGMALDYSPELDKHDARRKIGVITQAEIVGRRMEVSGYLFAKDFPEIVQEIRSANGSIEFDRESGNPAQQLGMSYEVTDVRLADTRAGVWTLIHVTFTGAAVLRRNKAAYENTWIALCEQ